MRLRTETVAEVSNLRAEQENSKKRAVIEASSNDQCAKSAHTKDPNSQASFAVHDSSVRRSTLAKYRRNGQRCWQSVLRTEILPQSFGGLAVAGTQSRTERSCGNGRNVVLLRCDHSSPLARCYTPPAILDSRSFLGREDRRMVLRSRRSSVNT